MTYYSVLINFSTSLQALTFGHDALAALVATCKAFPPMASPKLGAPPTSRALLVTATPLPKSLPLKNHFCGRKHHIHFTVARRVSCFMTAHCRSYASTKRFPIQNNAYDLHRTKTLPSDCLRRKIFISTSESLWTRYSKRFTNTVCQ